MLEIITPTMPEISENEVWRYLGRKNQEITPELETLLSEAVDELKRVAKPKAVLLRGNLEREGEDLSFLGINLPGEDIREHLKTSDAAVLMAVTLGLPTDKAIRKEERIDLARALVLDAAASVLVEAICDEVSDKLEEDLSHEVLYTTERFSPGYGDLPLSLQEPILTLLDAPRKIGLSVSDTGILFPRKSVTALTGIMKEKRAPKGERCRTCILKGKCKFGICKFNK